MCMYVAGTQGRLQGSFVEMVLLSFHLYVDSQKWIWGVRLSSNPLYLLSHIIVP